MIKNVHDLPLVVIQELESVVGKENVETEIEERIQRSRSTLSEGTVPCAIVKPDNVSDIRKILKIATNHGLSIHPISTGKNWGYGDACGVIAGQILLDLGRMNKILEVNEELAYATIEPGVTQGQLYKFLNDKKIKLWMDATGAGLDTSIMGNVLERGFGHSPYGDRFAHSCGYEIILPTGEILNTGFGHYKNSQSTEIYKWGVGPSLDGLFTQSNFGIVTKMSIWLLPKPETFKVLFFILKEQEDIFEFIEKIRPLKIDGTLKSIIHTSNDIRMISTLQKFPFGTKPGGAYLSLNDRKELIRQHHLGSWVGTAGFYGSQEQVGADLKKTKEALNTIKGLKISVTVDDFYLSIFKKIVGFANKMNIFSYLKPLYKRVELSVNLLQGKSPASSVLGGLWRTKDDLSKKITSTDPLDYQSGFYWISPILPMRGDDVRKILSLVEPVFNGYNFDLLNTLSTVNERSLCLVMTICFDKKNKEETKRAELCHDEVVKLLINNGYIVYRAGNQTMKLLTENSETYFDFIKKIKENIDPMGIISPGKYIPVKN